MLKHSKLTLLLFLIIAMTQTAALGADKKNVLFIICDDLNTDLGVYGHPLVKSPNIDRLASEGVKFSQAYCQYPLCGPSRASFMTGLYPDQDLIHQNAILLRDRLPGVQSMSQMFSRQGYTAVRIGKIYHYNVPADIGNDGHDDPLSWDVKFNPKGRDKTDEAKVVTLQPGKYGATLSWLAADGTDEEQTDGIAATHAVKLLGEYAKSKTPFFMAVGLYRPHTPYVAPKKYFDWYPVDKIKVPTVPAGYLETLPKPAALSISRKKDQLNLDPKIAKQAIQGYYASISFADAQIGRILEGLKAAGLEDDTIVIFTSDHGYHMGEHGHYQKTTLFENATHVPLIIKVPGMKTAGQATRAPAEMVDFYPTLAELCELPNAPKYLPGVSLAPVLADVKARPRTTALTQYSNGYSLRNARYRLTLWGDDGAEGVEFYDRRTDPEEMKNLAGDATHARRIEKLTSLLNQRIAEANVVPEGLERIPAPVRKKRK